MGVFRKCSYLSLKATKKIAVQLHTKHKITLYCIKISEEYSAIKGGDIEKRLMNKVMKLTKLSS